MDDECAAEAIVERLQDTFKELVFSAWDQDFLLTEEGRNGMRAALVDRYLASRRHAVTWLDNVVGISGKNVVEVGCGTGSSTVALAERNAAVFAIDIDQPSVAAAESRVHAHDVDGVSIAQCEAEEILQVALSQKADLYVLFAVLEHLTEQERFDTLHHLWNALEPGGALRDHRDAQPIELLRQPQQRTGFRSFTARLPSIPACQGVASPGVPRRHGAGGSHQRSGAGSSAPYPFRPRSELPRVRRRDRRSFGGDQ